MLKRLLLLLAVLLAPLSVSANIVNNSGSTAADSISIPFYALDSLGKPVGLVANDSVYLAVFYPNGSLAFRDTLVYNESAIDTVKFAGEIYYNWNLAVADIDGSGKNGVYSYIITTIDNTLALTTPHRGHFQLYQTADYNTGIDSILAAIARLDDLTLKLDSVQDTVYAVIDTVQNQDDWVASSANQTLIIDTVNGVIDTLQLQDGWIAKELSLFDVSTDSVLANQTVMNSRLVVSAANIGADAITEAKIANDAIAAEHLADDAIDYETFAATAPGAWWNEGKTGYALTTDERASIADSTWGADTTGFTAGGTFGYAATHGAATSLSEAQMAQIADSVWGADTTAFTAGGTFGYAVTHGAASSLSDAQMGAIADSVLQLFLSGSNEDSFKATISGLATLANQVLIIDTVNGIIDTLQLQDDWIALVSNQLLIIDTVNGIIDTVQLQDDWGATSASQLLIIDTVNGIIDTLQLHDDWVGTSAAQDIMRDTLSAVIDTAQSQDDWVAKQAYLDSIIAEIDTLNFMSGWAVGSKSYILYTNDKDSIFVITPAGDTIRRFRYDHPADTAGGSPDTVTTVAH